MSHILLTGCTGFLGSFLLRDALAARCNVAAVVRSQGRRSGAERVEDLVQFWERQLGRSLPRPVILEGNLDLPDMGLSRDDGQWLSRHCDTVLHCAARVSFGIDEEAGEPEHTNVGGVLRLLNLCQKMEIRRFIHVSTAYVAGRRSGLILENDPVGEAGFNNDYERTKAIAEQHVRSATFLQSATIVRPSIIVGESRTGFAPAFHGIYTPLRLGYLHLLAKLREGWALDESLVRDIVSRQFIENMGLSGSECKNLVPADWVSRAIIAAVRSPAQGVAAYHLTHGQPVSISQLAESMIEAVLLCLRESPARSSGIPESLVDAPGFRNHMQVYREYLRDDPRFDAQNIGRAWGVEPCPALTHQALVRLWSHAIEHDFFWRVPRARAPEWDLAGLFSDRLAPLVGEADVALEVTGTGGGTWRFAVGGDDGLLGERAAMAVAPRIVISAPTLIDLATGRLRLDEALDACRVAAFGKQPGHILRSCLPPVIDWLAAQQAAPSRPRSLSHT